MMVTNLLKKIVWFKGIALMVLFFSCSKEQIEKFDEPFVHIMSDNQSNITVNSNRSDVVSYYIYYSTKRTIEGIKVTYSVNPGSGLKEGRDYRVITSENPLLFPSGINRRPVQIKWLRRKVNPTEDNTLSIKIEDTDKKVNIGLPGPNNRQSEFIIKKKN